MIANCMIAADCYHQDVDACKLVHMVGYSNPNPIQLFIGLAMLFVTGSWFLVLSIFLVLPLGFQKGGSTWNKSCCITGCVETPMFSQKVASHCLNLYSAVIFT